MIFEKILDLLFGFFDIVLGVLPNVSFNVNEGALDMFLDAISIGMYLLPSGTVVIIGGIIIALGLFRIIVSVVKTIWDLIPLL